MSSIRAMQLRERMPRLAEAAVQRARLTVVPSRRRVRAARVPFVTLVSVVLVSGIVGLLCFNTQMQQASFAATALEEQAANLTARQQTLHDELQELRDPQRVAQLAQQAGMVIPETACTLRLGAAKPAGHCAAATAANTPTLLARPPSKPAVLNPAPHVVVVPAPQDQQGAGHHKHHGRSHNSARR
jgi:cell division protein FtsL